MTASDLRAVLERVRQIHRINESQPTPNQTNLLAAVSALAALVQRLADALCDNIEAHTPQGGVFMSDLRVLKDAALVQTILGGRDG